MQNFPVNNALASKIRAFSLTSISLSIISPTFLSDKSEY